MERVRNMPKWAKVLGLATIGAAVLTVATKVVRAIRGAEFNLSPEEIREAMTSTEAYQAAWDKLMAGRSRRWWFR